MRFLAGLATGLLALPILGVLGLLAMYATATVGGWLAPEPPTRPWVEVRGQDASAAGGVLVVFKDGAQAVRMTCRDACDDIIGVGAPARLLEVRNAGGECVACREREIPWWERRAKTWLVKGRPLVVEEGGAS